MLFLEVKHLLLKVIVLCVNVFRLAQLILERLYLELILLRLKRVLVPGIGMLLQLVLQRDLVVLELGHQLVVLLYLRQELKVCLLLLV